MNLDPCLTVCPRKPAQGFTLIELMMTVAMVGVLAAIAMPTYKVYTMRADAAQAEQEILKLSETLERHKGRNFSYKGFRPDYLYRNSNNNIISFKAATQEVTLPLGAVGGDVKYSVFIRDIGEGNPLLTGSTAMGRGWAIKAVSNNPNNFTFLATSTGVRCKNKTAENVDYAGCGVGTEGW